MMEAELIVDFGAVGGDVTIGTYIFWPMVEFSWKSRSTSMSKLQVVMHQVIPPTTCGGEEI